MSINNFFNQKIRYLSNDFIIPTIEDRIATARSEILIISPWIYHKRIKDILIEKAEEGIKVKVITRPYYNKGLKKDNKNHEKTLFELDQAGTQIKINERIHMKNIVIDKKDLIHTSKNLTNSHAIDSGLWIKDLNLVKILRSEFYSLYYSDFCRYENSASYRNRVIEFLSY